MTQYKIFYGIGELHRLNTSISLALDTETLQLQPEQGKLRLIQLGSFVDKTIVLIDCFDLVESDWQTLDRFFNNGERFWLAHNAVFDIAWLQEHGIHPRGKIGCTMLASRLLSNGIPNMKHGLDALMKRHLDTEISKEQQTSNWGAERLSEEQLIYAAKDVEALMELDTILEKKLLMGNLTMAYALECKAIPALAQMWRTGLPWNAQDLEQCRIDYEHDAKEMGAEFLRELDAALPEEKKLPREGDETIRQIEGKLSEMGNSLEERDEWNQKLDELLADRDAMDFNLRAKDEGSIRLGTKKYKGFNINSPVQMLDKFTTLLGFAPVDATGQPRTTRPA